jgi:drug/metabolite transporter superfamily protein YnfA
MRRHQPIEILWRTRGAWEADYRRFARSRGFPTFNDWPYHRRGFLGAWAEPGFHRFWRVRNPGIAYFVHFLYIRVGGRRHWAVPAIVSFTLCGLIHTLVVAPFMGRWSNTVIVAFLLFGALTVLSRRLAPFLHQERWPTIVNVAINIGLVVLCFDSGFRVDRWIDPLTRSETVERRDGAYSSGHADTARALREPPVSRA